MFTNKADVFIDKSHGCQREGFDNSAKKVDSETDKNRIPGCPAGQAVY